MSANLALATPIAMAASADVPSTAVPGRQISPPAPQPESALPSQIIIKPSHNAEAPADAVKIQFTLNDVTVDGMTVFDPESVAYLWQSMIGQTITVAGLYDIANAITRKYADAGYILSFAVVPAQSITDGKVKLHVAEGYVDTIDNAGTPLTTLLGTNGDHYPQGYAISALADKILQSRPLKEEDLERYLLLINDIPGVTAHATFAASTTTPNASTLTINIERQLVNFDAHTDNRLPQYLGRWNETAMASLNGFVTGADSFNIAAGCGVSCNTYHSLAAGWSTLIGSDGLKLSINANHSFDHPDQGFLQTISFYGRETDVSLSADYPFIRAREQTLTGGLTFGGQNSGTWTFAGPLTRDQTRTANMHGSYDFADNYGGHNLVHAQFVQGMPVLGATNFNDPLKSRLYGDSTFSLIQMGATRNQSLNILSSDLDGFSLYLSGWAQVDMASPLLSTSQCSYGGSYIGRGYDSGALSGDHCLMGLSELRRDYWINNLLVQPYISADAGVVWQKGPLAVGDQRSLSAESVAGGVRLNLDKWMAADLQVAQPLRASPAENGKEDPRVFITLQMHF